MAAFGDNDCDGLDWRLLQNGSIILYWKSSVLKKHVGWLEDNGYRIDLFDCVTWTDKDTIHDSIAESLQFPAYYGKNLDALHDCLGDLEIPDRSGRVLVFQRFDVPFSKFSEMAWQMLDILSINARRHLLFGRRLLILIQSNDPVISFKPVGAQPVYWNPEEWSNKDRGF